MTNEVNAIANETGRPADSELEPKVVSKPKFMPTYHRNAYGQSDLITEVEAA